MLAGWMHQDWSVTNQANWHPVVRLKGFAAQYIVSQMKSTDDHASDLRIFLYTKRTNRQKQYIKLFWTRYRLFYAHFVIWKLDKKSPGLRNAVTVVDPPYSNIYFLMYCSNCVCPILSNIQYKLQKLQFSIINRNNTNTWNVWSKTDFPVLKICKTFKWHHNPTLNVKQTDLHVFYQPFSKCIMNQDIMLNVIIILEKKLKELCHY